MTFPRANLLAPVAFLLGCSSSPGPSPDTTAVDAASDDASSSATGVDGGAGAADGGPEGGPDAGSTGHDSGATAHDAGAEATSDAGADAAVSPRQELLGFLQGISGKKTLSGEHNREASQGDFISQMQSITGHYPALWGGDFLYEDSEIQNRPNVLQNLMNGWKNGAVISLMYHACPPTQAESCGWQGGVLSSLSDADWTDLTTDGGNLNQVWKSRLDAVAPYFQQLKDAGMAATFRPHHEMNQGVFWWGGRPGPNGTAKLYQITHDYLVDTKGLDNIVWVWSVQDIWNSADNSWDWDQYNPGDAYWDVLSLDFYDGAGYTDAKYQAMLALAGNKPIAIGECQVLPTPAELTAQPRWVYFMGWAELVQQNDSNAQITATYTAPSVLTRDSMPGW